MVCFFHRWASQCPRLDALFSRRNFQACCCCCWISLGLATHNAHQSVSVTYLVKYVEQKQYYSTTEWSFWLGKKCYCYRGLRCQRDSQILDDIAPDRHIRTWACRMEAVFGMRMIWGGGCRGCHVMMIVTVVLSSTVVEGTIWAPLVLQEFVKDGQNLNGVHVVDVLVGYTAARWYMELFSLHHMVSMVFVVVSRVVLGLRVMMTTPTTPKAQGVGLI